MQLIKMISDRMKANGRESLKEKNLTLMQSAILRHVELQNGRTTQKEIEEYMAVSHPTIVGIVTRMENNGYLKCYTDKTDRRQKVVELTEKAWAVSKEIHTDVITSENNMLKGLDEEELNVLQSLLEKVYANVEKASVTKKREEEI